MRLRRKSRLTSEVQTSAMNDIMFFLLLFFLIISTMANPAVIKVLLPTAKGEVNLTKKTLNLTITGAKETGGIMVPPQYYIDATQVPAVDSLQSMLAREIAKYPDADINVLIRGDISIQYAELIAAISACKQLNLPIALAVHEN